MPHWKSMMDRDFIFAFDLNGKEVAVTISRVEAGTLSGSGGRKAKKPVVYFEGKEKGLALNATNCKTIAKLYGNYTEKWIGKQVTLYPTTTEMAGETVECIRIRPTAPRRDVKAGSGKNGKPAPTTQGELEQALKDQGLVDETHQDRVDRVMAELSPEEQAEIARIEAEEAAQS